MKIKEITDPTLRWAVIKRLLDRVPDRPAGAGNFVSGGQFSEPSRRTMTGRHAAERAAKQVWNEVVDELGSRPFFDDALVRVHWIGLYTKRGQDLASNTISYIQEHAGVEHADEISATAYLREDLAKVTFSRPMIGVILRGRTTYAGAVDLGTQWSVKLKPEDIERQKGSGTRKLPWYEDEGTIADNMTVDETSWRDHVWGPQYYRTKMPELVVGSWSFDTVLIPQSVMSGAPDDLQRVIEVASSLGCKVVDERGNTYEPGEKMQITETQLRRIIKLIVIDEASERQRAAYQDIKKSVIRNRETYPLDDLRHYSTSRDAKTDTSRVQSAHDYPEGPTGRVPEILTPGRHTAGLDILEAWKNNADQDFFNKEVKKIHWLGFSSPEPNRTAAQALDDFLSDAPASKGVQISTVGYTGKINPGPRAGRAFQEGIEKTQIQLGIMLQGDTVFATSEDAYTTNPRSSTRSQVKAAKSGQAAAPTFSKVPRAVYLTLKQIVAISDSSHPLYDADLRAEYFADVAKAKAAAVENFKPNPAFPWMKPEHTYYDFIPKKWDEQIVAVSPDTGVRGDSKMMLDKESWREPFVDNPMWNEVIIDNWTPVGVYLNPFSATKEQIKQIKSVADKHGLKLFDLGGGEINMADFDPRGREQYAGRQTVVTTPEGLPASVTSYDSYQTKSGQYVHGGVSYDVKESLLRALIRRLF